jgi:hypothetical protein
MNTRLLVMPVDRLGQFIHRGSVILSLVHMKVFVVVDMDIVYLVGRCIDHRYPNLADNFLVMKHFKQASNFEVLYDTPG